MNFLSKLEKASKEMSKPRWSGTFKEFLSQIVDKGAYPDVGVLAHERVYKMITSKNVVEKDYFGKTRKSYEFFENELFGVEETIDQVMQYMHSAAQKSQSARRMLLLYGPPSSGKSQLADLIKKGLEQYTRTEPGAVFAIKDSPMHENPLLLVPKHMRAEFQQKYGIEIEGDLSPYSLFMLDKTYNGNFMDVPIEQIYFSEATRVGIGTWLPNEDKIQEPSELIGSIDFAKIQQYGDEADPRTYNFNGELNVANRGVVEFIEGIKGSEKFLRVLLTATQEKTIKAPRFGLIYTDVCIILHSNENEFNHFISEKRYEAYHDRMVIVKAPYNLRLSAEVKIYEKLLGASRFIKDIHIAPNTIQTAAMFAVLSRMEKPKDGDDLTLIKKMKLYDEQSVKGFKVEQVPDIKRKCPKEGMYGVSPRFIIDQIGIAIAKAKDQGRAFITALDVLRQLKAGISARDTFNQEAKNRYEQHLDQARLEMNECLQNDIQKAFFLSFEDEARNLFGNYLDQIEAACSGEKPIDPATGEEVEINETLMKSVENHIKVSDSGRDEFRNEIIRAVSQAARKNRAFDYSQHAQLREAINKQLFEERKGVIRMTVSARNPDQEALQRLNEVVDRMVKQQGYSAESANELLKYATAHVFDR